MFITGPDVVQAVTGEKISQNGLGGADVHSQVSVCRTSPTTMSRAAWRMCGTCSRCCRPTTARCRGGGVGGSRRPRVYALLDLVPADANRAYDMRLVIERSSTTASSSRSAGRATSSVSGPSGWARGGHCGQPTVLAGRCVDIHASEKAARFVRLRRLNIPW